MAPASTMRFCRSKAEAMSARVTPLRLSRAGLTVTSMVRFWRPNSSTFATSWMPSRSFLSARAWSSISR